MTKKNYDRIYNARQELIRVYIDERKAGMKRELENMIERLTILLKLKK